MVTSGFTSSPLFLITSNEASSSTGGSWWAGVPAKLGSTAKCELHDKSSSAGIEGMDSNG